jgi:hypothetical protein
MHASSSNSITTTMMQKLRLRFKWIALAPVLAILAMAGWALASPVGSSPDDDFHLVSTWCAGDSAAPLCMPGPTASQRIVPEILVNSNCYAFFPQRSADCLTNFSGDPQEMVVTNRGNFVGGYPPVFYKTMHIFASSNFELSVLLMRMFNVVLLVGLFSGIYALVSHSLRRTLIWTFLLTTLPMGLFLIASNNPSSWAIIGVPSAIIALLGYFEATRWKKVALGGIALLSTVVAAGARSDAAIYVGIGVAAILIMKLKSTRQFVLSTLIVIPMAITCVWSYLSANQILAAVNGFSGVQTAVVESKPSGAFGLLFSNAMEVPTLWAGIFGEAKLGWMDTSMPAVVSLGALAAFILAAGRALAHLDRRRAIAIAFLAALLWSIPVYILTVSGDRVGVGVQSRYLLPLIMLFAAFLFYQSKARQWSLSRGQLILVAATLSVAQLIALHFNIRRYVTSFDVQGWNLNSHIQWWWNLPFGPMTVLLVGSISYALLVWVLARHANQKPAGPVSLLTTHG